MKIIHKCSSHLTKSCKLVVKAAVNILDNVLTFLEISVFGYTLPVSKIYYAQTYNRIVPRNKAFHCTSRSSHS